MAFLGSQVTTPSIGTWYATINKPPFNPPNWIFAPVWTLLFLMMGIAAYLVWKTKQTIKTKAALSAFVIQLILNFLWSYFFFSLHNPLLAFVDIVALWIAIYITMSRFRTISRTAGLLLVPYLAWVSFASLLNLAILVLN